jgi:hypothetical protein
MTLEDFLGLCSRAEPPAGIAQPLLSLWWDAHGDWDRAHAIAQEIHTAMGSLVHAYLHRKEGDQGNAGYWYGRAGRPPFRGALEEEWRSIAKELCGVA